MTSGQSIQLERRIVTKSSFDRYLQDNRDGFPDATEFHVCADTNTGISPFIYIGRNRIFIGGWQAIERNDSWTFVSLNPYQPTDHRFNHLIEVSDEAKYSVARQALDKYHAFVKSFGSRTEFFDSTVREILSICDVAIEDIARLRE